MGFFGSLGGQLLGSGLGQLVGGQKGRDVGQSIGKIAGEALIPFKKGGKVKRTGPALLHKNEFVLPASVKPTKAQKMAVAKLQKKSKSKKM